MSFFPDMGCETMIVAGSHIRAVGWLHPGQPFPRGDVPAGFVSKLKEFASRSWESTVALYWDACQGWHECEFCDTTHGTHHAVRGSRNFGVPSGVELFVAPEMIGHYVEQHGYSPPAEFIAAVLASPLPGTPEYLEVTEQFRQPIFNQREEQRARWLAEAAAKAKSQVIAPRLDPDKPRHLQFFPFTCPFCGCSEDLGLWFTYKICSRCGKGVQIVRQPEPGK